MNDENDDEYGPINALIYKPVRYEGHFYVRRIGLYLYKNRIYSTISIYILKGLAFVYQLI